MLPFAKLKVAVQQEQRYAEYREMVGKLCPMFGIRAVRPKLIELDKAMEGKSLSDIGSVFLGVVGANPSFDLYVTERKESFLKIFKKDWTESELMKYALKCMAQSYNQKMDAMVLFKLRHMGLYVLHNFEMRRTPKPRILFPATKNGMQELSLMTLDNFIEEFLLNYA